MPDETPDTPSAEAQPRSAPDRRRPRSLRERLVAIGVGLVVALVALEITLRLVGFGFLAMQDGRNRRALESGGAYTVLCIGESITAVGGRDAYPAQLEEVLDARGGGVDFAVINGGIPASNSTQLLDELEANLDRYQPDLVVAMMGANDNQPGSGSSAIPYDGDVPVGERTGFPHWLKTYRLARQALHTLDRAAGQAPMAVGSLPGSGAIVCPVQCEGLADDPAAGDEREACEEAERAWNTAQEGHPEDAEARLRKALARHPNSPSVHVALAVVLIQLGGMDEAENLLVSATALDSGSASAWNELAALYSMMRRWSQAERAFRSGLRAEPGDLRCETGLGHVLVEQGRCDDAVSILERAVRASPDDVGTYHDLGTCLERVGREAEAVDAYREAIDLSAPDYWFDPALERWTVLMERLGRTDEVEPLFAKVLEARPLDDALLGKLASHYRRSGDRAAADRLLDEARQQRSLHYCPVTRANYQRLHSTTRARGITLVAAQYPRRDVALLRRLFDDSTGVLFAGDPAAYERELERSSFDAVFVDDCYGDFGHGTRRGNRLLAEGIATVILDHLGLAGGAEPGGAR